jgi:3-hydroxyisobutyrate dehydrogenase
MKIGFIGTGIMGSSMAGHLMAAGHTLHVYNRTRSKAEGLTGTRGRNGLIAPLRLLKHRKSSLPSLATPRMSRRCTWASQAFCSTHPKAASRLT